MRTPDRAPTFLRIRWWQAPQGADGAPVIRAATLCATHRTEITVKSPKSQSRREIGSFYEFCQSRSLRKE